MVSAAQSSAIGRARTTNSSPLSRSTRKEPSDSGSEGSEPIAIKQRSPEPIAGPSTFSSTGSTSAWSASKALDGPVIGASPRRRISMPPSPDVLSTTPPSFKSSTARRRLSHGLNDSLHPPASPTSSPFASFAGSYEQSLLAGRMSTLPSKPLRFSAEIGMLAAKGKGKSPKIPPHITIDFEAFYYDLPAGTPSKDKSRTPYVGTLDLEQHYIDSLLERSTCDAPLPKFPGYRLPAARGQVQITVRNESRMPIKLFLVPFDVTDMRPGEKTFVRQKTYEIVDSDETKHALRYAAHLQFCAPPSTSEDQEPRIYLHTTIRLVFSARAPDAKDQLKIVHEGPGINAGATGPESKYSKYSGPSEDWLDAKSWARARTRLSSSPSPAAESFSPGSVSSEHFLVDSMDVQPVDPDAADLDAKPYQPLTPRGLRYRPGALSPPPSSALPSPTLATASSEFVLQRRTSAGSGSISPTRGRHGAQSPSLLDGLTALTLSSRPSSRTGRATPPLLPLR